MVEFRPKQWASHHEGGSSVLLKVYARFFKSLGFADDFLFGGGVILWLGWVEKIDVHPGRWKKLSLAR
jgi:hypothetical protein